jgi:gas vesicle protein
MSRQDNSVLTFVIGLGVGAIAALLFAPKAGKDLRSDLADSLNDGMDQLRSKGGELRERAAKYADVAQDNVQEAIEAGQKAYRQAKA